MKSKKDDAPAPPVKRNWLRRKFGKWFGKNKIE